MLHQQSETHNQQAISIEQSRLRLWLPVLLGCGIALYFSQNEPTIWWPYVLVSLISGVLCRLIWHIAPLRFLLVILCAVSLGMAASGIRMQQVAAPVLREQLFFKQVEGTIEDIQHKEKKVKLVLTQPVIETLPAARTPYVVSVTLKKLEVPLRIGDRIRLPSMLFPPPTPVMPGAYDFSRMFYFKQLGAVGFSPRQPEVLTPSPLRGRDGVGAVSYFTGEWLTSLRLSISDHLVENMGLAAGSVASALIVGEQSRVPEEISEDMRDAGIYHILSISGLHMSIATGLLFLSIRFILALIPYTALHWPTKKIAALGGLLGGLAYLLLAGSPTPAVRSYIMVACVLTSVLVDRKGISMVSLGWAATIILLVMPESLFTASFQFSFAATLAIIGLYERYGYILFQPNASIPRRIFIYFIGLMLTSLAATLYTSPLAIAHFNRMAIYGIAANMLMVPLSSFLIMPSAMLAMIFMPFGLEAPFLWLLKQGLDWMIGGSALVAGFPWANIILPPPTDAGFVLIIAGGLWFALWMTRIRWLGVIMVVAGLSTIALFKPYDLIVSGDAKRVAYRSESGQWVMIRGNVDSYEAESWLRMQGATSMLSRTQAKKEIPELMCDKTTCMMMRGERSIVVAIKYDKPTNLCESGADIVVSDRYLFCDMMPYVIDQLYVSVAGSVAIRLEEDHIHVETTQEDRGLWPWVEKVRLVDEEDDAIVPSRE